MRYHQVSREDVKFVNARRRQLRDMLIRRISPDKRLKVIAQGSFTWIVEGLDGDSVFRITAGTDLDASFYQDRSIDNYFEKSAHSFLPKVLDRMMDENDWLFDKCQDMGIPQMRVFKVERLEKLKSRALANLVNKTLHAWACESDYGNQSAFGRPLSATKAYLKKWAAEPLLAEFRTFFEGLSHMCADYGVLIDNVAHDLMVRPSTGELVVSDPVVEVGALRGCLRAG